MPSLYDQDSGNGVTFGDNARRVVPSTKFGTRQIQRWAIYTREDIATDWDQPNSLYSQLVRAIQQNVELYAVYMPGEAFFNSDDLNYAFSIDAAVDTSVDLWTATNSNFGSEVHPMDWTWNPGGNGPGDFNPATRIMTQAVTEALDNAGADNYCWVTPFYVIADQTWPIGTPGQSAPGASRDYGNMAKADPTLVPQPGDTQEILNQKKLKFLAKLRGN